jgi:predicted ATPase/class 3 adenylate cyclase
LLSKIISARASGGMVGERRVVTLLFCDVKGSTAAAEQLDPEEWAEIMNGAFEHLIRPIYRYEGTLARLMGDAILAFFGAPITHEDDPQRAVLAGLDILQGIRPYCDQVKRRWNLEINVRVGINTGLVVVGEVGSDLRMEYTALGDAINLASRMEQTAEPGTIQLTENTYRLIEPLFEFEQLGEINIRGKLDPVPVYRVVSAKSEPGRLRGIEGLEAPLIGRDHEMAILRKALENLQLGIGKIVCLVGEAGLGKSRLVAELISNWESQRREVPAFSTSNEIVQTLPQENRSPSRWIDCQVMSYDSARPYALFQQFLRRAYGITKNDSGEVIEEKLNLILETIPANDRENAIDIFNLVLGNTQENTQLTLDGEAFQRELFDLIRDVIHSLSLDQPIVLVFDDLHWADPASVELLQHLFPLVDQEPILLLCVFRPDRNAPAWELMTKAERDFGHRYTEIYLNPLSEQHSNNLVDNLLVISDLPVGVRQLISHHAEGNPFFVEEIVRTLIDRGLVIQDADGRHWQANPSLATSNIGLPDNLRGLLMSRIDSLEEDEKHTLQLAAVIGRRFNYQVLKALEGNGNGSLPPNPDLIPSNGSRLDHNLENLQKAQLIYEVMRLPEHEFSFRHALIQEAAYDTILLKKRREFHLRVAEFSENLYRERLEEHAALLEHHFYEAGDDRALNYARKAGDNAFRLYANTEAITHYNRAIEIINSLPSESRDAFLLKDLYTHRGRAYELNSLFSRAMANYEQMEQYAREHGEHSIELAALMSQAQIRSIPNELYSLEEGEKLCERALKLAREHQDQLAEAKILWNQMNLTRLSDKNLQALEAGERSLEILRELPPETITTLEAREQLAFTLNDLYHVSSVTQNVRLAIKYLEEARELWQDLDNKPMLADNLATTSIAYLSLGDFNKALDYSEQAYQLSKSIKNLWGMSYSLYGVSLIYWERGEVDHTIRIMEETIALGEQADFAVVQAMNSWFMAWVYGALGDFEKGFSIANEMLTQSEAFSPLWLRYSPPLMAELLILTGDLTRAEEMILQAEPIDEEMNPIFVYFYLRSKCKIALAKGRLEEAYQLVQEILTKSQTYGSLFYLEDLYLHGQVLLEMGHDDKSYKALITARDKAKEQGSKWSLWMIQTAMSEIERRFGKIEEAERSIKEARENLTDIADHISDPKLQEKFLQQPEIHKVFE